MTANHHESGGDDVALAALRDLLLILALDMSALDRFVHEPHALMTQAGISEEDQRLLLAADPAAINERLWGEDVPMRGPLLAVEVMVTAHGPRPLVRGTGTPVLAAALEELARQAITNPSVPGAPPTPPPAAGTAPATPAGTPAVSAAPTGAAPAVALPAWTSHAAMPAGGDVRPFGHHESSFAEQHELPARSVNAQDFDLLVTAVNMQPALSATVLLTKAIERATGYPIETADVLTQLFDTFCDGDTVTFGNRTVTRRQFEAYVEYFEFPVEGRRQLMSPLVAIFEVERHRELRDATASPETAG